MANPNILGLTELYGKTAVQSVTTSSVAIVSNTAGSGKVLKVNSLILANIDGTNTVNVTVDVYRSSTAYCLSKLCPLPAGTSIAILSKDTSVYLEEGDSLRCQASADSDAQAICSYEELG